MAGFCVITVVGETVSVTVGDCPAQLPNKNSNAVNVTGQSNFEIDIDSVWNFIVTYS